MYLVTSLKARVAATAQPLSRQEAEQLREDNRYLEWLAEHWKYEREIYQRRAEELANFQRLYGPTRDLAVELIPAQVVGAGSLPYDASRVLHTSGQQAVREGEAVTTRQLLTQRSKALPPRLAVISSNALVGRIVEPGAFTARLQLLTDGGFHVRGRIRRIINPRQPRMVTVTEGDLPRTTTLTPDNNAPIDDVMARGDGAGGVLVEHVKAYHNVLPGDLLLTSDSDPMVPTEIHVGKVVAVQRDPKDPRRVSLRVQPHADLEALHEVYIISPVLSGGE